MTKQSHLKILDAGFVIIRRLPGKKMIQAKTSEKPEWHNIEACHTVSEMNSRFEQMLKNKNVVEELH